jgi:hypothetical protein
VGSSANLFAIVACAKIIIKGKYRLFFWEKGKIFVKMLKMRIFSQKFS